MEGLRKKEKKTRGHRQQCSDCWGEVGEGIGRIKADGSKLDLGW